MLMWQGYFCVVKARKKQQLKRETTRNNAKQTNKGKAGRTGPGPEDNTKSVNARMVCPRGSLPQPQQPSEPTEWSIQIQPGRKREREKREGVSGKGLKEEGEGKRGRRPWAPLLHGPGPGPMGPGPWPQARSPRQDLPGKVS